uniref:Non-specific lipid-transfer protein n=1 Tax=Anthurium amnicola TaxID=1678845 RepID=A0A1D1ZJR4_9ARAE
MESMVGRKLWVLCLVVAAIAALLGGRRVTAAVQCGDAVNALVPCGPFLLGVAGEDNPSSQCCQSAQLLNKMATTVEMRRELCKCLLQAGPSFGVTPGRARRLPSFCKLKLEIPVSPNVDCNKIS